MTSAELLSVRMMLAIGDESVSDIRIALDLVERFLEFLALGPGELLANYKRRDPMKQ
jgi:hypothetical protein